MGGECVGHVYFAIRNRKRLRNFSSKRGRNGQHDRERENHRVSKVIGVQAVAITSNLYDG